MARPSRGASRQLDALLFPGCAVITSFEVDTSNPDTWNAVTTWTAGVVPTSIRIEYQVNGGVFATYALLVNPATPFAFGVTWSDFAANGDLVGLRSTIVGPGACAPSTSAVVSNVTQS